MSKTPIEKNHPRFYTISLRHTMLNKKQLATLHRILCEGRKDYNETTDSESRLLQITMYRFHELSLAAHQLSAGEIALDEKAAHGDLISLSSALVAHKIMFLNECYPNEVTQRDFAVVGATKGEIRKHISEVVTLFQRHTLEWSRSRKTIPRNVVLHWFQRMNRVLASLQKVIIIHTPTELRVFRAPQPVFDALQSVLLLKSYRFVDIDAPQIFFEKWLVEWDRNKDSARKPSAFNTSEISTFMKKRFAKFDAPFFEPGWKAGMAAV